MASPQISKTESALSNGSKVGSCPIDCTVCGNPISAKRLVAVPTATECISCLEASGDVPLVKRYDEYTPNGDVVSTTFTKNKRIEAQIRRVNRLVPPDEAFETALGDDSHLVREKTSDNEHAYSMTEAFEPETVEQEREQLLEVAREHIAEHITENVVPITTRVQ